MLSCEQCFILRLSILVISFIKKNIYNFRKNENCIVSYFGCIDHCSCVGLCVVTASSSARLVTSDQLHKHRYLQINTGHIVKVARRCMKRKMWGK